MNINLSLELTISGGEWGGPGCVVQWGVGWTGPGGPDVGLRPGLGAAAPSTANWRQYRRQTVQGLGYDRKMVQTP